MKANRRVKSCLVSDRVSFEEAKSVSFPCRTASYGSFCEVASLHFRSVSTEEKLLREALCVPQNLRKVRVRMVSYAASYERAVSD
jgi:hypothetical protein